MMKQNKDLYAGSLLLEVVIALAVMGTLLTAILILQTTLYKRFITNEKRAKVLFLAKPLMVKNALDQEEKKEKQEEQELENLSFSYTVQDTPVEDEDLLRFKNLIQKKVTFSPSGYYYLLHATKPLPIDSKEKQ